MNNRSLLIIIISALLILSFILMLIMPNDESYQKDKKYNEVAVFLEQSESEEISSNNRAKMNFALDVYNQQEDKPKIHLITDDKNYSQYQKIESELINNKVPKRIIITEAVAFESESEIIDALHKLTFNENTLIVITK